MYTAQPSANEESPPDFTESDFNESDLNQADSNEPSLNHQTEQTPSEVGSAPVLKGEYSRNGEFHRNLNPNWNYYPIYVNKVEVVDELLQRHHFSRFQQGSQPGRILDAGCGEGVLVEKYAQQGWDIIGVDKNYASAYVQEGSILEIPFQDNTFDTVMALDVLEHLNYHQQPQALKELKRVLKPDGVLIFSCPNLAHFTGRLKLMFRGKLLRTASWGHHPGDRPMCEYEELFAAAQFEIVERIGLFPTVPPVYRMVMRHPAHSVNLIRQLRKVPFPVNWNFQILFACRLTKASPETRA